MAAVKNSLSVSESGLKAIKEDEGSIDGIYNDPSGYCTFGVGHLVHSTEKWGCFLLKAASSNKTWKGNIKKKWPGRSYEVSYLEKATAGSKNLADLEAKAVEVAKETIAKKKHNKEFDKLDKANQTSVTASAKSLIKEESRLLALQVSSVLKTDIQPFEKAVNDGVTGVALSQDEFDALVSLAFNIGVKNFKSSTLLKKINENKFRNGDEKSRKTAIDAIEKEFSRWNRSGGKVLPGLTKRRKSEASRFLKKARQELEDMKKKPRTP